MWKCLNCNTWQNNHEIKKKKNSWSIQSFTFNDHIIENIIKHQNIDVVNDIINLWIPLLFVDGPKQMKKIVIVHITSFYDSFKTNFSLVYFFSHFP